MSCNVADRALATIVTQRLQEGCKQRWEDLNERKLRKKSTVFKWTPALSVKVTAAREGTEAGIWKDTMAALRASDGAFANMTQVSLRHSCGPTGAGSAALT